VPLNQAQNKSGHFACISRHLHILEINILLEIIRADTKFKNVYVTNRILLHTHTHTHTHTQTHTNTHTHKYTHTHNVRNTICRNIFSKIFKYFTVTDLWDVVLLTLVEIHRCFGVYQIKRCHIREFGQICNYWRENSTFRLYSSIDKILLNCN
jgi:hypothetical protein